MPPLSGTLGKAKTAPIVLTATYSLGKFGGLTPYFGAGINYTAVLKTADGDISAIDGKSAWRRPTGGD
jgi:outer membrane protein W